MAWGWSREHEESGSEEEESEEEESGREDAAGEEDGEHARQMRDCDRSVTLTKCDGARRGGAGTRGVAHSVRRRAKGSRYHNLNHAKNSSIHLDC